MVLSDQFGHGSISRNAMEPMPNKTTVTRREQRCGWAW